MMGGSDRWKNWNKNKNKNKNNKNKNKNKEITSLREKGGGERNNNMRHWMIPDCDICRNNN